MNTSLLVCQESFYNWDFFNHYDLTNWTVNNELPGNSILDIACPDKGYLYLGSYEGLIRFDGVDFDLYNRNTDSKYGFISARSLFVDSEGNFWVGSNTDGVSCIRKDGTVRKWTINEGLSSMYIRSICEDLRGNIWLGTTKGVVYIDPTGRVRYPLVARDAEYSVDMSVTQVFCDSAGRIWICGYGENLLYLYENDRIVHFDRFRTVSSVWVDSIAQSRDGAFYMALSPDKVLKYETGKEIIYDVGEAEKGESRINYLYVDSNDNVWCAREKGVSVITPDGVAHLSSKYGNKCDKVYKIYEDEYGNIWISTERKGLFKLTRTRFRSVITDTVVNSIAQDTLRDCMWIGTDDGILCYQNGNFETNSLTQKLDKVRIRHINFTEDNKLIVSTYGSYGVIVIDSDESLSYYNQDTTCLTTDMCRVSMQAHNGDLYIGTVNGLLVIEKETGDTHWYDRSNGLRNEYVMNLFEDTNHSVWVGTNGGGVYRLYDYVIDMHLDKSQGLAGDVVYSISRIEGNLWFCTDSGISVYNGSRYINFDSSSGLVSDNVGQILLDFTNTLWITCNRGIFSAPYSEFAGYIQGKSKSVKTRYFGKNEGITCAGSTTTSNSVVAEDGCIWFNMVDGFTIYNPLKNFDIKTEPKLFVKNIVVDTKVIDARYIDMKEPIILEPKCNKLRVNFAGICYNASSQIKYSVKLEGYDKDYSEWSYDRFALYNNMNHGTYHLRIRAMSNSGVIGELTQPVIIIKRPRLIEMAMFWVEVVIIITVMAAIQIYIRFFKVRKYSRNLKKDVDLRTTQLLSLQHNLERQVEERTDIVKQMSFEITQALASTIDAKDPYTKGHSNRVATYSKMLAEEMGKSKGEVDRIYIAASLHDIGKIGIPDYIIQKSSSLTKKEVDIVREHPIIGGEILENIHSMPEIKVVARYHHERWDGKGYPYGLSGEDIPEIARIVCVADTYDAMTSNRNYRRYMPQEDVRMEIEKGIGTQFDPTIAKIMLRLIDSDIEYNMHE